MNTNRFVPGMHKALAMALAIMLVLVGISLTPVAATAFAANSISAPSIQWQKCLGGSNNDYAYDAQQTADGGYVVALRTDGSVSGFHGSTDILVVKLNSVGEMEWQKCYGGSSGEEPRSIKQTEDGGYIVVGFSGSNNGDVSGNHGDGSIGCDIWVLKLDSQGIKQWQKCLGGSDNDWANSVQITSDGGYIISGGTFSKDGDVIGNANEAFWVVKLSSIGELLWQTCINGLSSNTAESALQKTEDGGLILVSGTYVTGHGCDEIVVKLDSSGAIQWKKLFGGSYDEYAYDVQQTADGGYIVAGKTSSNDGDVSGNHGLSDGWVTKLNPLGEIQWQKCLGGLSNDRISTIEKMSNGDFICAGYTESNDHDVNSSHGYDIWVVELSSNGEIQWQKCLGGSDMEEATSIHQTTDNGFVISGYTFSNNGDVSGNHGNIDGWVVKLGPATLLSSNANLASLKINGMPVPGFDPETLIYDIGNVVSDNTDISIIGLPEDQNVIVSPIGTLPFNLGANTYNIKLTAQDNVTTKTYTIRINRTAKTSAKAIYVVPGIMGSELVKGTDTSQKLWFKFWDQSDVDQLLCLNDGKSESDIIAYDDLSDNKYGATDAYGALVNNLAKALPAYQVIFFPYDWRLDNRTSAERLNLNIGLGGFSENVLVCHSMGGLVASEYIAKFGDSSIAKLITLGTPYLGSPKCLLSFTTGKALPAWLNFLYIPTVSYNYTSCYELLPTEQYFNGYSSFYIKTRNGSQGNFLPVSSYADTMSFLDTHYGLTSLGDLAKAFQSGLYSNGKQILTTMSNSYFIVGYGKDTISSYSIDSSAAGFNGGVKDFSIKNGDDTVPLYSATIGGTTDPSRTYYVNETHTGLVNNIDVHDLVTNIINDNPETYNSSVITRKCPADDLSRIKLDVACPVNVQVFDSTGALVGQVVDNNVDQEDTQDGSFYTIGTNNDHKIIFLDPNKTYTVKLSGTSEGSMYYSTQLLDANGNPVKTVSFSDVPLEASTKISTDADVNNVHPLSVDKDGDGNPDLTVQPEVTIYAQGLVLDQTCITLPIDSSTMMTPTFSPSDTTNKNVGWASSNLQVATVSSGTVHALSTGVVTITAKTEDGGYTAQCTILVPPSHPVIKAQSDSYNSIQVSWNAVPGATNYEVSRSTSLNGPYVSIGSTTSTSLISYSLITNSMYYYKVRAYFVHDSAKVYSDYSLVAATKPILAMPTATAVSMSYNSINTSWAAISGATGYEVYRSLTSAGTYTYLASTSSLSYVNDSLATNQAYYYKVRAYRLISGIKAYSDYSSSAMARPVLAAPGAVKAVSASYNSIKVTWGAMAGATKYELYRSTSSVGTYKLLTSTTALFYSNTSTTTGTTYYYKVRTYRVVGSTKVYSAYSAIVSAKAIPGTPTSVKAMRVASKSIKTSWGTVKGATKYEVWRATTASGTYYLIVATGSISFTNTGLVTGKYYYYKVRAYRLVGTTKVFGGFSVDVSTKP